MSVENSVPRQRGISNLVVALILVAVAAVGGSFIFVSFYEQMQTMTKTASLRTQSLDVVSTTSGDIATATVKNNGTVVLENVKVKIMGEEDENLVLSIGRLSPGQTGSDHAQGDWGFMAGETYPVLVTAKGPAGENVISRAMSVRVKS